MQTTSHLLMIEPVNFSYNAETAVNNAFQVAGNSVNAQEKAAEEFHRFADLLRKNGVDVTIVKDTAEPYTPDSIFPNNWISFHDDGTVVLYPMFAVNRRLERKQHVLDVVKNKFHVAGQLDLSGFEKENIFLEGTGSMVLDRDYKIAYACLSPRTNHQVLETFCEKTGYHPVMFTAVDRNEKEIYHTNVMMCVADRYVVICLDSIRDKQEKALVVSTISKSKKSLVDITCDQMNHFAGNMLQVENKDGIKLLVMSSRAFNSLTKDQVDTLQQYNKIVHSELNTIETNGGGSARCMMAEIHLPLA